MTMSMALAPASDAAAMRCLASAADLHRDAAMVWTWKSGRMSTSVLARRDIRGAAASDPTAGSGMPGSPAQTGRSGWITPLNAGCANTGLCARHDTYGLRSRNTLAAFGSGWGVGWTGIRLLA